MGVRRLFSRGQNFPRGRGAITYSLPKKILFSFTKSQIHTILAGQRGARAPSWPTLRTPMNRKLFLYLCSKRYRLVIGPFFWPDNEYGPIMNFTMWGLVIGPARLTRPQCTSPKNYSNLQPHKK